MKKISIKGASWDSFFLSFSKALSSISALRSLRNNISNSAGIESS